MKNTRIHCKVLSIDVKAYNLSKTITIGNIYRHLHDNNDSNHIEKFIDEISPIIDIIHKENNHAALVNELKKYTEVLYLMCTNKSFIRITVPRCIAEFDSSDILQNTFQGSIRFFSIDCIKQIISPALSISSSYKTNNCHQSTSPQERYLTNRYKDFQLVYWQKTFRRT